MSGRFVDVWRCSLVALAALAVAAPAPRAAAQEADAAAAAEAAGSQLQARLQQGIDLFNGGDYEASVQAFSEVIAAIERASAYQPGPYLYRAKALAQLEDYEASIEDLKNALTYAQGAPALLPEIQNTRGEVYIELGAYQLALPDLQAATQADRANPQYQFNLGKTLVSLGGPEPGEKALTKYIESEMAAGEEEQRSEALQLRGLAYVYMRKNEKAHADFQASLAIDPTRHETYFSRAQLDLEEKNYAAAVADLSEAIENYTPDDEEDKLPFVQAHLARASAFEELGKESEDPEASTRAYEQGLAECVGLLEQLPENDPQLAAVKAATQFRKGVLERLLGRYGDAVRSFSQALQLNPALGEAYFRRGICFHYKGEEKLAIRDFEQAASINFDSPRANLWKGMSWAQLGDYNEAIRAYGESVAVSDRYTPAYVNRGLAHLHLADYSKAVEDFNEAIRLDPTNALHYYRRGRAYSLAGEPERAIQSLMNAIAFDANQLPAYEALAEELEATGQDALASEYRLRAAELRQP